MDRLQWAHDRMAILQDFSDAGERFLRFFGFTEEYRLGGFSFFSVEGHLRNLRECEVGTHFRVYTDMISHDAIRLHIYQYMVNATTAACLATGEHMMLHVDTVQRRACPMGPQMQAAAEAAMTSWAPRLKPLGLSGSIKPAS
ncbi:hypothetical protein MWN34_14565 [Ancylobacter sp. 6x-1]|uniref:Thioesterase n=1 Tax=Ancylobacter crimeensis TaxID=2579147 RepID=A0ABT0DDT3_9HYPH|nr:thioesterase family protein [Ancylobacter crimeensis]MCK0198134.1 hypothetical protein [Ancylobacter crimeensis]